MAPEKLVTMIFCALAGASATAGELRVAVASNFTTPVQAIAAEFKAQTEHEIMLIPGSTGKLYAQINNGLPIDIFLAADAGHPARLEDDGLIVAGSRFTYAIGQLVLWSPKPGYISANGSRLTQGGYNHLAIANPQLAPYGKAAQEVLESMGLWALLYKQIVRGENVSQTYLFIDSGNAELGFISLGQITKPGQPLPGSLWIVPQQLYSPIEQQAVLIESSIAAEAFIAFLKSNTARTIISSHGFAVPEVAR
jgi:molybdate transport system substrate-binding protein